MKYYKLIFILYLIIILASCGKKEQEYIDVPGRPMGEKNTTNESTQKDKKDTIKNQTQQENKNNTENKSGYTPTPENVISPLEARDYVGKFVTLRGYVAEVYKTEAIEYLNFMNKYPNNPIAGVIFKKNFEAFGDISVYSEKNIEATGRITTYKDKLEIILDSPSQIKVVK